MGITQKSIERLNRFKILTTGTIMLELGAQNLYDNLHYGQIAKDVFTNLGVKHYSVDIIPHQGAAAGDLREDWQKNGEYTCITNFGTTEHVDGSLYQPFKNIHEACCIGGLMIHENPRTENWIGHGYHYITQQFYVNLALLVGYEILELAEEAAMGNYETGINVCAVLRKTSDIFLTEQEFDKLYNETVFKS